MGLSQQLTLVNEGDADMPVLLAFHTAVNAPFAPGSTARDYKLKLTIGSRWELSKRMLPTGRHQPLSPEEEAMKTGRRLSVLRADGQSLYGGAAERPQPDGTDRHADRHDAGV